LRLLNLHPNPHLVEGASAARGLVHCGYQICIQILTQERGVPGARGLAHCV
jgi:hypothetical protein